MSTGRSRKRFATHSEASTSLRGHGWWYDRVKRRYIPIHDHAIDAAANLKRYRIVHVANSVLHDVLRGVGSMGAHFEAARDELIPKVCAQGFIRIRWVPRQGTLGWQFHGRPAAAMITLLRFIMRHEIGPITVVTFTDFASKTSVDASLNNLDPIRDLCRRHP